ncbi:uridine kinase [Brevibacterium sp. UCMA 11754]|uniref:uridine kinase n=1 Tax=Brevibacterium sp. UCMA 11754 TaxID=2749198 RepID=UPI001F277CC0|nr:uridine kinase [Brevibacterium sp. UCMA 11754]MCF2570657.1 uridine kinase [Brevibacterium sp. UCMA 11754]
MPDRRVVLRQLLSLLREVNIGKRVLVAIDGLDGAGKTVLAEELVEVATQDGLRPISSLSIDGFHHPRSIRYANGRGPDSFYRDSYDHEAFIRSVVTPFRHGLSITPAVWDVDADLAVTPAELDLPDDCVLLVDGIFLHRPELRELWDVSVWVQVPFAVSVPRGNERFPGQFDSDPEAQSNHRYVGGQRLYFAQCSPWDRATWIFDNEDLARPAIRGVLTPLP